MKNSSRLVFCSYLIVGIIAFLPALSTGAIKEDPICEDGQCSAAIALTEYFGWDAYRLSDGRTEAIVVPAIGRVMSFGRAGGDNWLWSAMLEYGKARNVGGWKNWGGDKTWLAPQSEWKKLGSKNGWPPAQEWDGMPFKAEVISGGHLKLTGPISPATGARIIRELWHDDNGEFIIKQTVEKLRGGPVTFGVWSITQVDNSKIDAVFLPLNTNSDYDNGFRWLYPKQLIVPMSVASSTLQVVPTIKGSYKIGTDAPVAAIAVMRDDWAFIERASRPEGEYPDGEEGKSGTPVQLYGTGDAKMNYLELELLSPLRKFVAGARWSHTVRWRLEQLPSSDINDPAVHAAIEKAFIK